MTKTTSDLDDIMSEMMSDIVDDRKKANQLKLDLANKQHGVFKVGVKLLFQTYSNLYSFGWRQYTPYFNDGDTCTFSANIDDPAINGISYWYSKNSTIDLEKDCDDYEGSEYEKRNIKVVNVGELDELCGAVVKFLNNFDETYYLSTYGDHIEITVTPEGVKIDEYEHD